MGMYLALTKGPKQKGIKKFKKCSKKYLEKSFTKGTFNPFFSKNFVGMFTFWTVDGEKYQFNKN